ncbi:hypothetical protein PILCRDRAFT_718032 [Piloderma croceum F 1598]|uniref:Uncharacterized protein n=1 Tax=Piloderma croceum (strain F 1598) TaxID=765440 RepID=A0A0C3AJ17_PILCF|nr:hypothetical protein PILCRDRAFT_718032 [Piloderma croceum F 1598]
MQDKNKHGEGQDTSWCTMLGRFSLAGMGKRSQRHPRVAVSFMSPDYHFLPSSRWCLRITSTKAYHFLTDRAIPPEDNYVYSNVPLQILRTCGSLNGIRLRLFLLVRSQQMGRARLLTTSFRRTCANNVVSLPADNFVTPCLHIDAIKGIMTVVPGAYKVLSTLS